MSAGSPFGRLLVIANPRAGHGASRDAVAAVRDVLRARAIEHDVTFTQGPGHATRLAREALDHGVRFVAAMGGDGTLHEVVNGVMDDHGPRRRDVVLGIVPSGTGCDTARTFGLPQDPAAAAAHLAGDGLWGRLDIGRIRYRGSNGEEMVRWFLNVAEAGIGANVVVSAARMPAWLGANAYRLGALKAIIRYRPQRAHLRMHGRKARSPVGSPMGEREHEGTVTMVVVANCQFFGGGLRVAPRAIPSDAMLDVLVGEGTKWEALRALRRMPSGTHVPDPGIAEYLVEQVVLDGPEPLLLEADGEPLGTTPASFDVVRDAIALKI